MSAKNSSISAGKCHLVASDGSLVSISVQETEPEKISISIYDFDPTKKRFVRQKPSLSLSYSKAKRLDVVQTRRACSSTDGLFYVYILFRCVEPSDKSVLLVGRLDVRLHVAKRVAKFSIASEYATQDMKWDFVDGPFLVSGASKNGSIVYLGLESARSEDLVPTALALEPNAHVLGYIQGEFSDYKTVVLARVPAKQESKAALSAEELLLRFGAQGLFTRAFLDSPNFLSLSKTIIQSSISPKWKLVYTFLDQDTAGSSNDFPVFPHAIPLSVVESLEALCLVEEFDVQNERPKIKLVATTTHGELLAISNGQSSKLCDALDLGTSMFVPIDEAYVLSLKTYRSSFLARSEIQSLVDGNVVAILKGSTSSKVVDIQSSVVLQELQTSQLLVDYVTLANEDLILAFGPQKQPSPAVVVPSQVISVHDLRLNSLKDSKKHNGVPDSDQHSITESPAAAMVLKAIRKRLQNVKNSAHLSRTMLENKKILLENSLFLLQNFAEASTPFAGSSRRLSPLFPSKEAALVQESHAKPSEISIDITDYTIESSSILLVQCKIQNLSQSPVALLGCFATGGNTSLDIAMIPTTIGGSNFGVVEVIIEGNLASALVHDASVSLQFEIQRPGSPSSRTINVGSIQVPPSLLLGSSPSPLSPLWQLSKNFNFRIFPKGVNLEEQIYRFSQAAGLLPLHESSTSYLQTFRSKCGRVRLTVSHERDSTANPSFLVELSASSKERLSAALTLLLDLLPQECNVEREYTDPLTKDILLNYIAKMEETCESMDRDSRGVQMESLVRLEEILFEIQTLLLDET